MFESSVRSQGDLAGVFEYEDDSGYFYLYRTTENEDHKVTGAIQILTHKPDFDESEVVVQWDTAERIVGLFISGRLWAAFDSSTGVKYGGAYRAGGNPQVPAEVLGAFKSG